MYRCRMIPLVLCCGLVAWGCGEAGEEEARDLSLPPAESVATLDDSPQAEPTSEKAMPDQPVRRPPPPRPAPQVLPGGTVIELVARDTISNVTHAVGDTVWATSAGDVLDDKGDVIRQKTVYTGNTFTEEEIKELPQEEIDKALMNRFGKNRINVNIGPGEAVPFMIIFENLPENLSEFTVEAVSASRGE